MSKSVKIGPVNFTLIIDSDPLRARFIAKTSNDLDHLNNEDDVQQAIDDIEHKLGKVTNIKWSYDPSDPGAGYSFIPDMTTMASNIEKSFPDK